jgi:hypothetical protein
MVPGQQTYLPALDYDTADHEYINVSEMSENDVEEKPERGPAVRGGLS